MAQEDDGCGEHGEHGGQEGAFDLGGLDFGSGEERVRAEMEAVRRATSGMLRFPAAGAADLAGPKATSGLFDRSHVEADRIGSTMRGVAGTSAMSATRMFKDAGAVGSFASSLDRDIVRSATRSLGGTVSDVVRNATFDGAARGIVEMQGLLTGAATAAAAAERESAALKEARRVAGGRIGDWTTSSFAKTALDGLYAGSGMGGDRNRVLGHAGLLGSFSAVVNEALTLRDLTGGQAGAAFRALRQQVEAGSTPSVIERAMRASHTAVFPATRPPRASEIGSVIEGVLSELKPRPE